jgi:hypothetical protein
MNTKEKLLCFCVFVWNSIPTLADLFFLGLLIYHMPKDMSVRAVILYLILTKLDLIVTSRKLVKLEKQLNKLETSYWNYTR